VRDGRFLTATHALGDTTVRYLTELEHLEGDRNGGDRDLDLTVPAARPTTWT
jgi:hypothetical protein